MPVIKQHGNALSKTTGDNAEAWRLKNRVRQRTFRAKQSARIKELEELLEVHSTPDNIQVSLLQAQNLDLRNKLQALATKVKSCQSALEELSQASIAALGDGPGENTTCESGNNPSTTVKSRPSLLVEDSPASALTLEEVGSLSSPSTLNNELEAQRTLQESDLRQLFSYNVDDQLPRLSPEAQLILASRTVSPIPSPLHQPQLSLTKQLGPESYAQVAKSGSVLVRGSIGCLCRTNSQLADHLSSLEYFLKSNWTKSKCTKETDHVSLQKSATFMVSMFIHTSWDSLTAFFSFTQSYLGVAPLLNYRLNPGLESLQRLAESYLPTKLQMSVSYPCIIDWIPWPQLRDNVIKYHSANPCLDQLICDVGNTFAVQADLSKYIEGIEPVIGYLRVMDLVSALKPCAATRRLILDDGSLDRATIESYSNSMDSWVDPLDDSLDQDGQACSLPAPNVDILFGTRSFALRAFQQLILVREEVVRYRADPEFFQKYPELYDPGIPIAVGPRLGPRTPCDYMVPPRTMDKISLRRYEDLANWILTRV